MLPLLPAPPYAKPLCGALQQRAPDVHAHRSVPEEQPVGERLRAILLETPHYRCQAGWQSMGNQSVAGMSRVDAAPPARRVLPRIRAEACLSQRVRKELAQKLRHIGQ